jgi:hypothetical protein
MKKLWLLSFYRKRAKRRIYVKKVDRDLGRKRYYSRTGILTKLVVAIRGQVSERIAHGDEWHQAGGTDQSNRRNREILYTCT